MKRKIWLTAWIILVLLKTGLLKSSVHWVNGASPQHFVQTSQPQTTHPQGLAEEACYTSAAVLEKKNAFWATRQMSGWIMVSHNFTTIKVREQIITNYGPANCHGLLKNTSIYKLSSGGQIKLFEGQLHPAPTFVDPLSSQVFPGSTCRWSAINGKVPSTWLNVTLESCQNDKTTTRNPGIKLVVLVTVLRMQKNRNPRCVIKWWSIKHALQKSIKYIWPWISFRY